LRARGEPAILAAAAVCVQFDPIGHLATSLGIAGRRCCPSGRLAGIDQIVGRPNSFRTKAEISFFPRCNRSISEFVSRSETNEVPGFFRGEGVWLDVERLPGFIAEPLLQASARPLRRE
jgi:hypothetical protein